MRWVLGEYEDDVTPERGVRRQNVVGRCRGGGGFIGSFGAGLREPKDPVEFMLYVDNPLLGLFFTDGENWPVRFALAANCV